MTLHRARPLPLALLLLACACDRGPRYAESFTVVHIRAGDNVATQLAVHACAGLQNRRLGGSIFVQTDADVAQEAGSGVKHLGQQVEATRLDRCPAPPVEITCVEQLVVTLLPARIL